jgi:hypothetical protein
MTDSDIKPGNIRALADAALAAERRDTLRDDVGNPVSLRSLFDEPPDPAPVLARAVLRLLDDNRVLTALRDAVAETLEAWEAAEDCGSVWDTQDWKLRMGWIADRIAKEGK